jgi:Ca2+-binding RTX toxin-like protein
VGDTVTAKIVSNDVGKFALDVNQGKIRSVTNWYAYNEDKVFLPKTGGEFTINLGATPDNVTHIIDLPQRAELLSVLGDGQKLDFSFNGQGKVVVKIAGIPTDQKLATTGADSVTVNGDIVELNFTSNTTHTAQLFFRPDQLPTVLNPLSNITVNQDAPNTTIDLSQVFTDPDDDISKIVKSIQTNSNTGLVNAQINGNTLTLDYLQDQFGTSDITIRGTSNGKTVDTTFKVTVNDLYANYNQIQGTNNNNTLFGSLGNDRIYGLAGNDTIYSLLGNNRVFGESGNDILIGSSGNDYFVGGTGNDRLNGDGGVDVLIGVDPNSLNPGRGEFDILGDTILDSLLASDRFILGDANNVYYNDGNSSSNGTADYALITGFTANRDVIQLKGKASDYSLAAAPRGLPSGTGIYWNGDGQPELIGIISQQSNLNLSGNYFSYV